MRQFIQMTVVCMLMVIIGSLLVRGLNSKATIMGKEDLKNCQEAGNVLEILERARFNGLNPTEIDRDFFSSYCSKYLNESNLIF